MTYEEKKKLRRELAEQSIRELAKDSPAWEQIRRNLNIPAVQTWET